MKIYEAAERVLKEAGEPLHLREIHRLIVEKEYFEFGTPTPERVIGVALDRRSSGVSISRPNQDEKLFYRSKPATYGLREWLDATELNDLELDEAISEATLEAETLQADLLLEEDLHRFLFRNLKTNRLAAFGHGALRLFDEESQEEKYGKFRADNIGEIDMLLVNEEDHLIVIEIKKPSVNTDKSVGQICRYYGWVKSQVAKEGQKVFGLILAKESEKLRYAISATVEDITCREWSIDINIGSPV